MKKINLILALLGVLVLVGCASPKAHLKEFIEDGYISEFTYEEYSIVMNSKENMITSEAIIPELGLAEGENSYVHIDVHFIVVNGYQVLYITETGNLANLNNGKVAKNNEAVVSN